MSSRHAAVQSQGISYRQQLLFMCCLKAMWLFIFADGCRQGALQFSCMACVYFYSRWLGSNCSESLCICLAGVVAKSLHVLQTRSSQGIRVYISWPYNHVLCSCTLLSSWKSEHMHMLTSSWQPLLLCYR
jgi:hypothetical protein